MLLPSDSAKQASRRRRLHLAASATLLAAWAALFATPVRADDQAPDAPPGLLDRPSLRTGKGTGHERTPPAELPPTEAVDAAPVERLFDDWGGLQPPLQSRGLNVQFNALTEFGANVA